MPPRSTAAAAKKKRVSERDRNVFAQEEHMIKFDPVVIIQLVCQCVCRVTWLLYLARLEPAAAQTSPFETTFGSLTLAASIESFLRRKTARALSDALHMAALRT